MPGWYCIQDTVVVVAKTTDVVKEGDTIKVKLLGFDDRGKVRLSMKAVDQKTGEDLTKKAKEEAKDEPKPAQPKAEGQPG